MSQQQSSRPRGDRKTLIIGFDFGTHSTKVVLRERGKPMGRIAQFDDIAGGYTPFASPSLIKQVGNTLYFGTTALKSTGGRVFSSLKVSLLSKSQRNATMSSGELDDEKLVTAYFAWALQQVRKTVIGEEYSSVFLNVAAPMDHVENRALKERYLRLVQAAWQVSFGGPEQTLKQGVAVSEASRLLGSLLSGPILGPERRTFEVLPETIAPVVSLSLDPYMKPCIYAIVDMGAGTTEMSVFHAGDPGDDQKVLCYKDKTIFTGSNAVELAANRNGEVKAICGRIENEYRQMWRQAYNIDAANPLSKRRWKDLTLVLSGGGTRLPAIANRLRGTNPVPNWPGFERSFAVCRHIPGTLKLADGINNDDASMFAVANGLSVERTKWPVVFVPHEIEPLTAPEPQKPKPDWDDSDNQPRWV